MFPESPQFHRIRDRIDAVQACKDQWQQDVDRVFQSCEKVFFFSKFHTSRLLCLADAVVVSLDVRDVTQGDGHGIAYFLGDTDAASLNSIGISYFVGDTDAVQAGSEFTGIGR